MYLTRLVSYRKFIRPQALALLIIILGFFGAKLGSAALVSIIPKKAIETGPTLQVQAWATYVLVIKIVPLDVYHALNLTCISSLRSHINGDLGRSFFNAQPAHSFFSSANSLI